MTQRKLLAIAVVLLLTNSPRAMSQSRPQLTATLERMTDNPADMSVSFRISITMTPGWHIGAPKPGIVGVPTRLEWQLPSGWRLAKERWPTPTHDIVLGDTSFTYSGSLEVDATLLRGRKVGRDPIRAVLTYGICKEVCIPGRVTLMSEQ